MSGFIQGVDRQQASWFPEALDEYITEDNSVRAVDVLIDSLNLANLGFSTTASSIGLSRLPTLYASQAVCLGLPKLHNLFRSSTSTRLRVALIIKGLAYDYVPYALRAGETRTAEYLKINPQGLVPSLELEDGTLMTQSLAIIEWLDEKHPEPALLPADVDGRVRVRALAYMIACEIHPLNNLRVLFRLEEQFGADDAAIKEWFTHWVSFTFDALETALADSPDTARYCHGDTPRLADICLYAQVWNNRRFSTPTEKWPAIARIYNELDNLPEFDKAAPPNQPDAP